MDSKKPAERCPLKTLLVVAVVVVAMAAETHAESHEEGPVWGYRDDNGPNTWPDAFPTCGGSRQSPLALVTDDALPGPVEPFKFSNYNFLPLSTSTKVTNTGHSVKVTPINDASVSGGNLTDVYVFAQFHFHWGSTETRGSEHTVDGIAYPAELHFVHYRKSYGSLGEAAKFKSGLAVLAVPLELYPRDNLGFQPVIDSLVNITKPHETANIMPVTLNDFLPKNVDDFFRYEGSLTTPPCSEVVVWTVFKDPVEISLNQLEQFRQLEGSDGTPLQDNFRPVQPLNGRRVYRSWV